MSWGEVFKINKNMKRALNEQLRDLKFQEVKIITSTGTYTPTKTGLYKVICVGAGGSGDVYTEYNYEGGMGTASGGGGGVAISTLNLSSSGIYNVTVSGTASFAYSDEIILTATAGGSGYASNNEADSYGGSGGTASGCDNNYTGTDGDKTGSADTIPLAGVVSVYISDFSYTLAPMNTYTKSYPYAFYLDYGACLLGYGGGGTGVSTKTTTSSPYYYHGKKSTGRPAAIIIVPLELEE